jgi:hypothetical protein
MALGLFAMSLCLAFAAGCGGERSRNAGARLEGAVTLDGEPIAEGSLQFAPLEAGRGSPVAATIKDGRYVASAVPLGKLRVLVSASKKTGRMISEYSRPYEETVSIIPEKYQQGIEIDVSEDNPSLNFELQSR